MSVYSSDGYFSDSTLDPSDSDPDTSLPDAPVHSASSDDLDSDSDSASDDASTTSAPHSPSYDSSYSTPSSNAATTTIASLVTDYKFEHGRRYHSYSEGAYFAPNDSQQNSQLEIFHHIHRLILDSRLFSSPLTADQLSGGAKILDLGTGTGCWAIEFADIFPHAQVLGNDLSPVQPTWVPGNCTFEVDDFTKPWLHGQGIFSLVFARSIAGCVRDWKVLLAESRASLAPGGWFESVEGTVEFWDRRYEGGVLPEGSKLAQLAREGREAGERGGRGFGCVGSVKKGLEDAGFVDIEEMVWEVPIGGWMEDKKWRSIGRFALLHLCESAEGCSLALFTRILGWHVDDVKRLVENALEEVKAKESRTYYKLYITRGRRPVMEGGDSAYAA